MDLVTGPMGNLAPKLLQLLQDEYKLLNKVKEKVKSLAREIESMHLTLCKEAQVPYDKINPQVKLWTSEAREMSYDIDDILDNFLVNFDGGNHVHTTKLKGLIKKMNKRFSMIKIHGEIADAIEEIKNQVHTMRNRHDRYRIPDLVSGDEAFYASRSTIDPRILMSHSSNTSELVSIEEPRNALIEMLSLGDDYDASDKVLKIVSIVGFGGLGKTTLAKAVYDTMDTNTDYKAFVSVGRLPDLKKVFRDILLSLDRIRYMGKATFMTLDESQLIDEIQAFLKDKRYFIVIDDIWEVSSCQAIRTAFNDNNLGSNIVITTRNNEVAELVHYKYKMQPLSPDSSKMLFFRRIFGSQDKCPEVLSEISDKILKKCGGVPLAVITIGSLLANKRDDTTVWHEVCNSIGSGLTWNVDMYNDMRQILLLSFYDLPLHMKTCFLYLSMYPEDSLIKMDQLIWRWLSEGLIQPQRKEEDLFELGKICFFDLINRSLIQPVVDEMDDGIYACRVHDIVLDLLRFLSTEGNFVTTSNDLQQVMFQESQKFRRLSLNNRVTAWPEKRVAQVRSLAVFGPSIDSMSSFLCLKMLRVLDLEGCTLKNCGGSNLCVENLIHLRYLGLRGTDLEMAPKGIEKLQFLMVLKLVRYIKLPESIFELRRLMCIEGVHCYLRTGYLLRNLASLQVLDTLFLDEDSIGAVKELGHLRQLKVLKVVITLEMDQYFCDSLIGSLNNMRRLQMLQIFGNGFISWECWAPPPHLRQLLFGSSSPMLPKWISPTSLPYLTSLGIKVHIVRPEDIQILGTLPSLVALLLEADYRTYLEQPLQKFVVSADAFPHLRRCNFRYVAIVPSIFPRGAMSQVEDIRFCLRATDFSSNGGLDFDDLAMGHLPLLRYVACIIYRGTNITGEEEGMKLREVLKHAVDLHPNHPVLFCY